MLTRTNRLSQESEITTTKRNGRAVYNSFFKIKYLISDKNDSRFAVVVSTKVSKKAIQRNRLRRQCLEIIRLNLKNIKPFYNVVVWVNQKTIDADYSDLEQQLMSLFKKARLI